MSILVILLVWRKLFLGADRWSVVGPCMHALEGL